MGGRGRGRGSMSFRRLGFGTEDVLPPSNQPPPNFPPRQFKPIPLLRGKKYEYSLTLKQDLRSSFKEFGYCVPPVSMVKDIERYTDKYQPIPVADQVEYDKRLFPKELFEQAPKKRRKVTKLAKKKEVAAVEKLEVLEKKEKEGDAEEEEKEEEEGEEILEDEELEEETDYVANYFDNGESFLDEEEDNDDGYVF
ncbi:uncharacterized protein CEXT_192471 [Caerostris extrusa]|uniref:DNA-directed RNA polymerase III subunit n=1 Tax=Caerostris extrusa TaxID=172846 RepID=A0AAV4XBL0_CAEEX|nr:uncharacterized protein CEXT_192471 [Caerostris extrusa]